MHPDPQPRAGATGARFKSSPDASRCAPDLVALHPRPHLSPPSSPPPPMIPIRSVSLRRSQRCAERHNLLRKWRILKQKWHKSLAGLRPAPRDKMTFRLGARPDLRNTPRAVKASAPLKTAARRPCVVVVVVRTPTPNYLRQASQNLGKYVRHIYVSEKYIREYKKRRAGRKVGHEEPV